MVYEGNTLLNYCITVQVEEIITPSCEIFSTRQNIRDSSRKLILTTDHGLKYEDHRLKHFTYFFLYLDPQI